MNSDPFILSVAVVAPSGRLDALAAPHIEQELADVISAGQVHIVLDMHDVTYICSNSLRVLLLALRRLRCLGGNLVLCCLSPRVESILQMSGFDQVFDIVDTVEAARNFFADQVERG